MRYEKPQLIILTDQAWAATGASCTTGISAQSGTCEVGVHAPDDVCSVGTGPDPTKPCIDTGFSALPGCSLGDSATGTDPSCAGGFFAVGSNGNCNAGGAPTCQAGGGA